MKTTLRDIASEAGTSIATASAVLNGTGRHRIRVGDATRERIRAAAKRLGYTPNAAARSLVTGKTGVLGLVFPYSSAFIDRNPFSTQVMSGALSGAVKRRFNLMLNTAAGDDWNAAEASKLADSRTDGLLLVLPEPNSPVIDLCQRRGIPCIALVYDPGDAPVLTVNADDLEGGRLATRHLLSLGHRRIAHLAGREGVASTTSRQQGYLEVMTEARETAPHCLIVPAGYDSEDGYRAMGSLLELPPSERPTAVFAANDLCAEGALRRIAEAGLSAPGDIAIVGFDDTWFASMTRPALTSIRMPIQEMAEHAVSLLADRIEGREVADPSPVFPVQLIVRQSCGVTTTPRKGESRVPA